MLVKELIRRVKSDKSRTQGQRLILQAISTLKLNPEAELDGCIITQLRAEITGENSGSRSDNHQQRIRTRDVTLSSSACIDPVPEALCLLHQLQAST